MRQRRDGKRFVAGCCCLLMLAALFGCSGAPTTESSAGGGTTTGSGATEQTQTTTAATPEEIVLTVGQATGAPGDLVTIPVTISDNSYLVNADLEIQYDTDKLRLVSQYDESMGGDMLVKVGIWNYMLVPEETQPGTVHVALVKSGAGISRGGDLFSLQFEILEDLETPITISLEAQVVMTNVNQVGTDTDALASGMVQVVNGQVAAG